MKLPKPSVLRVLSLKHLKDFNIKAVLDELKRKAPTLLAILTAVVCQPQKSQNCESDFHVIAMAAAILLKQHNKHMCMMQTIVGCILHAGHASKMVC